jgi:hypothetical protein
VLTNVSKDAVQHQDLIVKSQSHLHQLLDSIKSQEMKHFEEMNKNWDSISSGLQKGIEAIGTEQDYIFQEQKEWHQQNLVRFDQIKQFNNQLSSQLLSSIEKAKQLAYSQDNLHVGIIEVQKEQIKSHDMIQQSLDSQQQMIQSQHTLKQTFLEMHQHTQESLNRIDTKSIQLEQNIEKSLHQQDDLSQQQKQAHSDLIQLRQGQQQAFQQARVSLQDLLHYSEETTKTIHKHQQSFMASFEKLFDTVKRLLTVHTSLLGEFMDLQSILFYAVVVVVSYCLTSTKYTANCRLLLFVVLTINVLIEKSVIMYGLRNTIPREQVYWYIWLSRKMFLLIGGCMLVLSWVIYKDYSMMSYKLLSELRQDIQGLKNRQVSTSLVTLDGLDQCTNYAKRSILAERYRMIVQELAGREDYLSDCSDDE